MRNVENVKIEKLLFRKRVGKDIFEISIASKCGERVILYRNFKDYIYHPKKDEAIFFNSEVGTFLTFKTIIDRFYKGEDLSLEETNDKYREAILEIIRSYDPKIRDLSSGSYLIEYVKSDGRISNFLYADTFHKLRYIISCLKGHYIVSLNGVKFDKPINAFNIFSMLKDADSISNVDEIPEVFGEHINYIESINEYIEYKDGQYIFNTMGSDNSIVLPSADVMLLDIDYFKNNNYSNSFIKSLKYNMMEAGYYTVIDAASTNSFKETLGENDIMKNKMILLKLKNPDVNFYRYSKLIGELYNFVNDEDKEVLRLSEIVNRNNFTFSQIL